MEEKAFFITFKRAFKRQKLSQTRECAFKNNIFPNGYVKLLFQTSMQDLENNNWIILDLLGYIFTGHLGNIYEIYANLIVMTLVPLTYSYR